MGSERPTDLIESVVADQIVMAMELVTYLNEDITNGEPFTVADVLDDLATAGIRLTRDPSGVAGQAYIKVLRGQ